MNFKMSIIWPLKEPSEFLCCVTTVIIMKKIFYEEKRERVTHMRILWGANMTDK